VLFTDSESSTDRVSLGDEWGTIAVRSAKNGASSPGLTFPQLKRAVEEAQRLIEHCIECGSRRLDRWELLTLNRSAKGNDPTRALTTVGEASGSVAASSQSRRQQPLSWHPVPPSCSRSASAARKAGTRHGCALDASACGA
jgi:hypothetical protein